MKKLFTAILSLSMAVSGIVIPVSAAGTLSVDENAGVYANEEEIIIPFSEDISSVTDDSVTSSISLKNASDTDVQFTYETDGTNLIIKPSATLKRDNTYSLEIASGFGTEDASLAETVTKNFKITTLVETDFANASSISDYLDLVTAPGTGNAKAGISGSQAFIYGGDNMAYVKGNYNTEKNYTAKFSLYLMGNAAVIAFNEQSKMNSFYADPSGVGFGWLAGKLVAQADNNKTFYEAHRTAFPYAPEYYGFARFDECDVADQSAYIKESNPPVWSSATELTPDSFFKPNEIKIDKLGTNGKFYVKDSAGQYQIIDDYETTLCGLDSTPETGYFGIGTSGQDIAIGDIVITKYEELIAGEELFVDENYIYADSSSITIPFTSNISAVGSASVHNNVSLTDKDGEEVAYTYQTNGMNLIISPIGGLTCDSRYTIKIGAGFGYSGIELKENVSKDFMVRTVVKTDFENASSFEEYLTLATPSGKRALAGGRAYISGSQNVAYLKGDYSNLENYTATFDLYQMGNATSIAFNASSYSGTASGSPYNAFSWTAASWYSGANNKFAKMYNGDKYKAACDVDEKHLNPSDAPTWNGNTEISSEGKVLSPNSIKIDKMGTNAKLYIKNGTSYELKDNYETMDCGLGLDTPMTGYFGIGVDGQDVAFGDVTITTYEEMQYGDITFNADEDIYASTSSITVPFNEDITLANNVANTVTLKDVYGNNVPFTYSIDGKVLTISPNSELERDLIYSLVISEGFGYSGITLKEEVAKAFRVKTVVQTDLASASNILDYFELAVTPGGENESVYAGVKDGIAYLQGGNNMAYLKGDYTNLENYSVNFSLYMVQNANFIAFNEEVQKPTSYVYNNPGQGYGWAAVGWFDGNRKFARSWRPIEGDDSGFAKFESATNDSSSLISANDPVESWEDNWTIGSFGKVFNPIYTKIDKLGTTGSFYIQDSNGKYQFIDTFDTTQANAGAPSTGYFGIGTGSLGIGFGDVIVTTMELVDGISVSDWMVLNEEGEWIFSLDGVQDVTGSVTVNSYCAGTVPVAVVAAAFEGNKMLKADVLDISSMNTGDTLILDFALSGIAGADQIKFFVWDSTGSMKPYIGAVNAF